MNTKQAVELASVRRLLASGEARRRREAAGLSLSEAASVCNYSVATLSRWETNQRRPGRSGAMAYARLLAKLEEAHEEAHHGAHA